jgi:hypothetical protein
VYNKDDGLTKQPTNPESSENLKNKSIQELEEIIDGYKNKKPE